MKFFKLKVLYSAAVSLLFLIMILLVYIGFSTYHTLNSNQKNAVQRVQAQGNIVIDMLTDSLKTIVAYKNFSDIKNRSNLLNKSLFNKLIGKIVLNKQIHHLLLINNNGKAFYKSLDLIDSDYSKIFNKLGTHQNTLYRHINLKNGKSIYEIIRKASESDGKGLLNISYIAVGIEMNEFEAAKRADINHAVIMAGILIILGGGAFFFIYVIRSYYHVNLKLEESRNYIHLLIENMANGLISINKSGEILSYNKVADSIFNISSRYENNICYINKIFDLTETGLRETIKSGSPIKDKNIKYVRGDNTVMPLLLNATPINENPYKLNGTVIILHDLSEVKNLEEKVKRSEKFAAIGKLSAVMAHEIRNPLSSIRGFANYFAKFFSKDKKNYEYAQIIIEEVDRIDRVISDLLNYSKVENLNIEKINLYSLVKKVITLVEYENKTGKTKFINNVPETLDKVTLDSDKIIQVLINIILNAIQITDGDVQITINAEITPDNVLILKIEDNGPGIHVEDKNIIFDPFFSLRNQGTGLGLSIAQKIIESHEGTVSFTSPVNETNKGTQFKIKLPLSKLELNETANISC